MITSAEKIINNALDNTVGEITISPFDIDIIPLNSIAVI